MNKEHHVRGVIVQNLVSSINQNLLEGIDCDKQDSGIGTDVAMNITIELVLNHLPKAHS